MLAYLTNLLVFNITTWDAPVTTLETKIFSNMTRTKIWRIIYFVNILVICILLSCCARSTLSSVAHVLEATCFYVPHVPKTVFFFEKEWNSSWTPFLFSTKLWSYTKTNFWRSEFWKENIIANIIPFFFFFLFW